MMRSFVLACVLLSVLAPAALAAAPVSAFEKTVVEGYAKVDNFSISCWYEWANVDDGVVGGTVEYRFDRRAKALAIGFGGMPVVLVKDKQAFLLLWRDKKKRPTYLEIKKDRAISWKDIDAASLAINKGCGPYAPWIDDGFSAVPWNSLAPCFVAPLLDGGKETLFSKGTKVWTIDPKLFNPDHEEVLQKLLETGRLSAPNQKIVLQGILETDGLAAPMLKKGLQPFLDANTINEIQLRVFLANCCLDMFEAEQPELDPAQLPTCFKTEDESSSWIYAFDRQAGTLSAAAGTIDSEQVLGCPGNESHFWIKKIATFRDGTFQIDNGEVFKINDNLMPVPLQLPEDAKTIGISDLRRSYLERMSRIDMEIILKQKAYLQGRLREVIQHESDVMAEMAEMSRQSAGSAIDREELEFARLHLALAPGSKQFYTYVLAELEKLIDELREGE